MPFQRHPGCDRGQAVSTTNQTRRLGFPSKGQGQRQSQVIHLKEDQRLVAAMLRQAICERTWRALAPKRRVPRRRP